MRLRWVNDCMLEDRLVMRDLPLVVMFVSEGLPRLDLPKAELARLAAAYDDAEFLLIDALENPTLAERFRICELPTTLVFLRGVEMTRHVGGSLEQPVGRILGPKSLPEDYRDGAGGIFE